MYVYECVHITWFLWLRPRAPRRMPCTAWPWQRQRWWSRGIVEGKLWPLGHVCAVAGCVTAVDIQTIDIYIYIEGESDSVCMYVCMHVYIYIYIYIHIVGVWTYCGSSVYICICIHTVCVYIYICRVPYIYIYIYSATVTHLVDIVDVRFFCKSWVSSRTAQMLWLLWPPLWYF